MATSLVFKSGKTHKFWNISISGSTTTTNYGKYGIDGLPSSKKHASADKAKKFMATKIA